MYLGNYVRQIEASVFFRKLESPVFELSDGKNYAMRVLMVREEVDYNLLTELAARSRREGRNEISERFQARLDERYDGEPPDRSEIEEVERRIAEHYQHLWEETRPLGRDR
jgi:hypothetical protein